MTARTRFGTSMLAGAAAGAALTWFEATKRHAALAAAAAKPMAHGQHLSTTSILAAGFVATTVAVGLAVFTVATVYVRKRYGRAAALAGGRRRSGYGGYSDYGDRW